MPVNYIVLGRGWKMAKMEPISVRFEEVERKALDAEALADDRSISALVRKIVVQWLAARAAKEQG